MCVRLTEKGEADEHNDDENRFGLSPARRVVECFVSRLGRGIWHCDAGDDAGQSSRFER